MSRKRQEKCLLTLNNILSFECVVDKSVEGFSYNIHMVAKVNDVDIFELK